MRGGCFYLGACSQEKTDALNLGRTGSPTHTYVRVFKVFVNNRNLKGNIFKGLVEKCFDEIDDFGGFQAEGAEIRLKKRAQIFGGYNYSSYFCRLKTI